MQYLSEGYFPIGAPDERAETWNGKIARASWSDLVEACTTKSLRAVGKMYGVSHEAVRRTLARAVDGG
jgi:hypothetical protein